MATELQLSNSSEGDKPHVDVTAKFDSDTRFFKDQSLLLIRIVIDNEHLAQGRVGLREAIVTAVDAVISNTGIS